MLQREGKRNLRSSDAYRKMENIQQMNTKKKLRLHYSYTQDENVKQRDIKQILRSHDAYKKEENVKQRNIKKNLRSHDVYKKEENVKQRNIKKNLRSHDAYRKEENVKQRDIKKNLRSHDAYRKEENVKQKDIKKNLRSHDAYREDENVKQKDIKKNLRSHDAYREDENVKQKDMKKNQRSSQEYNTQEKQKGKLSKRQSRKILSIYNSELQSDITYVTEKFKNSVQCGPIYVCTCCKRMLYRHSVVHVPSDRYKKLKIKKTLVDNCLTEFKSVDNFQWICKTCHQSIKKGKMPAQSQYNKLSVEQPPFELADLCPLEERLISLRIPFMQIVNLPRGNQKGIRGPAVNVPTSLDSIISLLPRLPSQYGLVPVKLKRKLMYRGHVMHQSIRPNHVMKALLLLKDQHPQYEKIKINNDWIEHSMKEDDDMMLHLIASTEGMETDDDESDKSDTDENNSDIVKSNDNIDKDETEDEEDPMTNLRGYPYNTCMEPTSHVYTGKETISLAPGEGQHPISFFQDRDCETLAFPTLHPTGKFGLNVKDRTVTLSMKRYFNQRILNIDSRFASNIEYLFFAQYMCEAKQILDNINIAMRKGSGGANKITVQQICNADTSDNILSQNEGFRFLQTIRGSYPYWMKTLSDLNAMVRQLDIPTWFCSFSAADLKWPEVITIIAQQHGVHLKEEYVQKMNWQEKCLWIKTNPVTVARHFEYRVNRFLHDVLLSTAQPIGKIIDYFIRTEFQQRGSPHIHCLFWIENAPKIGINDDDEVTQFIDRYISAKIPSSEDDQELFEMVTTLQRHTHSHTCRKYNKSCRFQYPKPPTESTVIAAPPSIDDYDPPTLLSRKKEIKTTLYSVHEAVKENSDRTLCDILKSLNLSEDTYMKALKESTGNQTVIYKRRPIDTSTNNYNPVLIKIWSANLDIQFVTNAYACAMYILSYVSKDERQMGDLLRTTAKECSKNDTIRTQLKTLGNVFLTHRELSAQEATYRLLPLPLKHCSRSVVFLNTGLPDERTHILKSAQKLQLLPPDSDDIFEKGIIDRYIARPKHLEQMCLADFGTSYRLRGDTSTKEQIIDEDDEAAETERDENNLEKGKDITLLYKMGVMAKRRKKAILRSPRFSPVKSPERYSHSVLMLYFPWRIEDIDLKGQFPTYTDFLENVKETVRLNQSSFEHCAEDIDMALQNVDNVPESAWDSLFSEQQKQQSDEKSEQSLNNDPDLMKEYSVVPEMETATVKPFSIQVEHKKLSDAEYFSCVQSLNSKQRQLFEKLLKWCRDCVYSEKNTSSYKPFHIYLTGGAGTGKSHVIKTIVAMIERELQPISDSPDKSPVLLTAPTGIAAANIDGITIHTAFSIPINCNSDNYRGLSNEKLASLRNAMENLRVLIVDEISMVGLSLLTSLHKRLQDIKGVTDNNIVFGGISVLAIGDFYQLPPVKQQPVYSQSLDPYERLNPNHIWKDYFEFFELTEIMRQKGDADFSNLLNRVRTANLTEKDIDTLKSRIVTEEDKNYPVDALHVYSTNALVDSHNEKMLNMLHSPQIVINSVDSKKDIHTNKAQVVNLPNDQSLTGGLTQLLTLAVGARVMLTKNIDIKDSLVNGMQGQVIGFTYKDDNPQNSVRSVEVKFDSEDVGITHRKQHTSAYPGTVSIFREESRFFLHKKGAIEVSRKQFPLKLCFASTIHKVQGLTTDRIVISFEGYMKAGQGYVALSRARTLHGLFLQNIDVSKIKTSKSVEEEMKRLKQQSHQTQNNIALFSKDVWTKICHINARSLLRHINDLKTFTDMLTFDVIFITETWLHEHIPAQDLQLPGYHLYRKDRGTTYRNHICKESCLFCNTKGGIAFYAKKDIQIKMMSESSKTDIECLFVQLTVKNNYSIYVALLYRPDYIPICKLNYCLSNFMKTVDLNNTTVVLGDFNIDYKKHKDSTLTTALGKTFRQIINLPTHISSSIIDHIYTNNTSPLLQSGVLPCYFSDHNFTYCILPTPGDSKEVQKVDSKTQIQMKPVYGENKTPNNNKFKPTRKFVALSTSKLQTASCDNSVEILETNQNSHFIQSFNLPSREDSLKVANYIKVKIGHDPIVRQELYDYRYTGYLRILRTHTCPCIIDGISGDGNCFFRAISKQLLGTEKYHQRLRHLICDFEDAHKNTFLEWRGSGLDGIKQHISHMRHSKKWATEIELLATATLFQTSIWEFTEQFIEEHNSTWKWIEIKPINLHQNDTHQGEIPIEGKFYIHHTLGIHYDCIYPTE